MTNSCNSLVELDSTEIEKVSGGKTYRFYNYKNDAKERKYTKYWAHHWGEFTTTYAKSHPNGYKKMSDRVFKYKNDHGL